MTVETFGNGGMTITGDSINVFRLLTMKAALKLEVKTGMKRSSRYTTSNLVREAIGSKTRNKAKLLSELESYIEKNSPKPEKEKE